MKRGKKLLFAIGLLVIALLVAQWAVFYFSAPHGGPVISEEEKRIIYQRMTDEGKALSESNGGDYAR